MELTAVLSSLTTPFAAKNDNSWGSTLKIHGTNVTCISLPCKFSIHRQEQRHGIVPSALAETAISVAVASVVVGTAASLLLKTTKSYDNTKASSRTCEECGGSGVCSGCNGEGFILKKLSDESADKARMAARNMATRYTAALPKKWSYCTKCSSSRQCTTCGGTGQVS